LVREGDATATVLARYEDAKPSLVVQDKTIGQNKVHDLFVAMREIAKASCSPAFGADTVDWVVEICEDREYHVVDLGAQCGKPTISLIEDVLPNASRLSR
jgi:hypothetical protein